ncbi:MAG: phosphodiester glycosidase family protein [Lachnospiraceae bacterium]|uniref:Phosphodiester glycosidase family protein n=1 Tax=Candidatus Weimeria bifida TaxID=2599074 RepID=A0A6N7IZS0_9FIRM|nr:phosphodiester glycosidase family protein [Candidatus Weimeria bifida]RRF96720.1 MAG: phosphodiester glycosidase family protein [Lachnospiraceae bacterium]
MADSSRNSKKHKGALVRKRPMKSGRKRRRGKVVRNVIVGIAAALAACYVLFVFSPIPALRNLRNLYIQTAMTTHSHKWLAEAFIPHDIIDEVMSKLQKDEEDQQKLASKWDTDTKTTPAKKTVKKKNSFYTKYWELDTDSFKNYLKQHPELTANGLNKLKIDNLNSAADITSSKGDKILAVDAPNNTIILGISGNGYVGKLAVVKDINQVSIQKSRYIGSHGEVAANYASRYNAEVVINCNYFFDTGGHGSGGRIKGACVIDGKETAEPQRGYWKFVGLKNDGKLYISNYYQTKISDYKWGIESLPSLVVDGKDVVDGKFMMGIQPRAAIGQTKTGDFLMLEIDGRQPGYSLGTTVAECKNILLRYKAYQAQSVDGGSSSIMIYRGKQITKPSSASSLGRFLPDVFVVKKVAQ